MKRALLLALLLGIALAGSALEHGDFTIEVRGGQEQYLPTGNYQLLTTIRLDAREVFRAFEVIVSANLPVGVELHGNQQKELEQALSASTTGVAYWNVVVSEGRVYDLSNAFDVVSWDNSVSLELDQLPETTDKSTITIRGWTDAATLCEKHNYTGFWGKEENCQVRIDARVGEEKCEGNEFAERSGLFTAKCSLKEGNNTITITATDPGGNTDETEVYRFYNKPTAEALKENILLIVGGLTLALLFIIAVVYSYNKKKAEGATLEMLRERQSRLFRKYVQDRETRSSGINREKAGELVENFKLIMKKDSYYRQSFSDPNRAINEHEGIFKDETVKSKTIVGMLRELYVKAYQEQRRQNE